MPGNSINMAGGAWSRLVVLVALVALNGCGDGKVIVRGAVTIDGQPIGEQQLRSYRVQSPLFDIALPNGNIITGQEGSTQGVSDGFWVFLPPLAPGAHDIHFRGSIVDYTTASQNNFVTESLYHITIAE
jgi:hypothetical protein